MQLSRDQHRIDDGPEVIDAGIADDLHDAGFGLDLTSATWQPLGKVDGIGSVVWSTSSDDGTPSGILPSRKRRASLMMSIERSVPAMVKRPLPNSMSASEASIRCAAARLPFSMMSFEASTIAIPVAVMEREPPVPLPACTTSLSPCSSFTLSKGTPRCAASTCADGVA